MTFLDLQNNKLYKFFNLSYIILAILLIISVILITFFESKTIGFIRWEFLIKRIIDISFGIILFFEVPKRIIYYIFLKEIFPKNNKN